MSVLAVLRDSPAAGFIPTQSTFAQPAGVVQGAKGVGKSPFIEFQIGSVSKSALYHAGNGTSVLVFRYSLVAGDSGVVSLPRDARIQGGVLPAEGLSLNLPTGQAAGSVSTLLPPVHGRSTSVHGRSTSVQGSSPSVQGSSSSVQGSPVARARITQVNIIPTLPALIDVMVKFDRPIAITQMGSFSLPFSIGVSRRDALYVGINGDMLVFRHVLQRGDQGDIRITAGDRLLVGSGVSVLDRDGRPADLSLLAASGGRI